jgi:hypothetical protein
MQVYVCACVCTSPYVCYVHVCMCACVYVFICVCVCVWLWTHVCTCFCVCACSLYMCVYVCVFGEDSVVVCFHFDNSTSPKLGLVFYFLSKNCPPDVLRHSACCANTATKLHPTLGLSFLRMPGPVFEGITG